MLKNHVLIWKKYLERFCYSKKMILKLFFKNLKIIFRSPLTIVLLILAPILLMFIVGFTYSGEKINDVNVGLIEYNEDFFDFRDIKIVPYNLGDLDASRQKCISDMKLSKVAMCVYFEPIKDNRGNLINANVYYYVDNTRPKISDILIRIFDYAIEEKTKEISKKTVTDIFSEIKDTVVFMKESKTLVDQIEANLTYARKNIETMNKLYDVYIIDFNEEYSNIESTQTQLVFDIDQFNSKKKSLSTSLISLESNLDETGSELLASENKLGSIIFNLESFAKLNPTIYNYVNKDDLVSIKSSMSSLRDDMENNQELISNLNSNLNSINLNEFNSNLDEIFKKLDEISTQVNSMGSEIDKFEKDLKEKEEEVKKINEEIGNRLNYFEELSNKDASKITEPIVREREDLFKNFKTVHQLAPTVVILVLLFIGLLLSNVLVSLEINSKAYFRNLLSPISQWQFIFALFLTSLVIILFQVLFLLIIMNYSFGIKNILFNLLPLFIIIIHVLLVFILLGIFLAYLFESIQVSILVTTFLMLFLFLLSGIIVPIEIMPSYIGNLVLLNPVVIGEDLIRQLFFFNTLNLSYFTLFMMYVYIIILIFLIGFASDRRKKKLF